MDIYCDRERQSDYPSVNSDALIKRIKNSEKISIDTVDKLLEKLDHMETEYNLKRCFLFSKNTPFVRHLIN